MLNFMQYIRPLLPVVVVILLCVITVPVAEANNGASKASVQKTATIADQQDDKQKKAISQTPIQKSVLDADMLERPLAFFKNSFSPEEEDDDAIFSHSTTVVIAVKALIASLLSTII